MRNRSPRARSRARCEWGAARRDRGHRTVSSWAPSSQAGRRHAASARPTRSLVADAVERLPGARGYLDLARDLRGRRGYDVVHAHFGLTGYPALVVRGAKRAITLHGTDVRHPRTGRLTRAILPRYDLVAAVSEELA